MKTFVFPAALLLLACSLAAAAPSNEPVAGGAAAGVPGEPASPPADAAPAPTEGEDPYALPEGGPAELGQFIRDVRQRRADAQRRYAEMMQAAQRELAELTAKAGAAEKAAAQKILEVEKDRTSEAYRLAVQVVLPDRVRGLAGQPREEQAATLAALKDFLAEKETLGPAEFMMARSAAQTLEGASPELALDAYRSFGELFGKRGNPQLQQAARGFVSAAKRLELLGRTLPLAGTRMDGSPLDPESLRGKVVLLDFWASWCPPCRAEIEGPLPQLYEAYRDRGFEIVGISIDQDRAALEQYLEKTRIPWTILHEKEVGGRHPLAVEYGINSIPTMFLLDREGKVVSLSARGETLKRLLQELIGPPWQPQGELTPIDIQGQGNLGLRENFHEGGPGPNTLEEVPAGDQELAGIRFHIGEKLIHLGSQKVSSRPLEVKGIPVGRPCARLYFLHAAAFYDSPALTGQPLGGYVVHYDDGTTETIPIVAGQEVLNWFRIPSTLHPQRGVIAWEGENPMTREEGKWEPYHIFLYASRWVNPHPEKPVASLDFVSANTEAAPFCVAVTAEAP